MDTPKSRPTNVFRIEGVLFVQWATYSRPRDLPPPGDCLSESSNALVAIEHELRRDGHHVVYETFSDTLWHFVLSGPEAAKDAKNAEHTKKASTIIYSHLLQRTSAGSLRATDVTEALENVEYDSEVGDSRMELESDTDGPNVPESQRNALVPGLRSQDYTKRASSPAQTVQDSLQIYSRLLTAIGNTLSYAIAATKLWIPICSGRFIARQCPSVSYESSSTDDTDLESPFPLSLWSMQMTWLPDGTLLMIGSPFDSLQESEALLRGNEKPSQDRIEPIVLAPLGLQSWTTAAIRLTSRGTGDVALYGRQEHGSDEARSWRDMVVRWLRLQGIELSVDCTWIQVRTKATASRKEGENVPVKVHKFLWPRELCYNTPRPRDKLDHSTAPISDALLSVDSLAEAESWCIGKADREKTLQMQRLEKQRREQEEGNSSSDDDSLAELLQKNDGMLDVQAMSGIYPTPPDGPISHAHQSMGDDRAELQASSYGGLTPGGTDQKTPTVTFDQTAGPEDADIDIDDYDHIEEDDLFGNMQGQGYANNGVTEDDFSFFDEPGETPMAQSTVSQDQPTVDASGCLAMSESASPDYLRSSKANSRQGSYVEEAGPSSPQQDKEEARPKFELQDTIKILTDSLDIMDWEGEKRDSYPKPDFQSPSHSSLIKTDELDIKYSQSGKFAPTDGNGPYTAGPGLAPNMINSIPSLVKQRQQSPDSDYESDSTRSAAPASRAELDIIIDGAHSEDATESSGKDGDMKGGDSIQSQLTEANTDEQDPEYLTEPSELLKTLQLSNNTLAEPVMSSEPKQEPVGLPQYTNDYIQLAQIFADQIVYYENSPEPGFEGSVSTTESSKSRSIGDTIENALQMIFPHGVCCNLETCTSIGEDATAISSNSKASSRPTIKRQETLRLGNEGPNSGQVIFPIHPPNVRAKRGEKQMDISYPALRFWEDLGLSPFAGPKNVFAFCVFPDQPAIRRGTESFLSLLSYTYTSLRLGKHDSGHPAMKHHRDGLVAVPLSSPADLETFHALIDEACSALGHSLQTLASLSTTIVIYMANPIASPTGVSRLCKSFMKTFESYAGKLRFITKPSDLVLKVIPLSYIASPSTLVVPSVPVLIALSKEIYDRCPFDVSTGNSSIPNAPYASNSLVEITPAIPKALDFKVSPDVAVNPFHREAVVHVAYCWEPGATWLTAALTDARGASAWSAAFYIGHTADLAPILCATAKEMLEVAVESVEDLPGPIRVIVAKDTLLQSFEVQAWTDSASTLSHPSLSLVLIHLDPSPPLRLRPPAQPTAPLPLVFGDLPPAESTPSTPDVPADALAPEIPPHARAVEMEEEAWGAVTAVPMRIEGPDGLGGYGHGRVAGQGAGPGMATGAAANGYIIKGDRAVLGVRVLDTGGVREGDGGVREVLGAYHGLACVGKARGLGGDLPWHVSVARKMGSGMERGFRDGAT